jgi:ApbE superfamily uncharacterized protein (UPF0280 family)
MHQERFYRKLVDTEKLTTFQVVVQETDLLVHADRELVSETRELILEQRGYVEAFIKAHPGFLTTLAPWKSSGPAPKIISDMAAAGAKAGVGPMAAVAGAIAEYVGQGLLNLTDQVIVENGGDLFIKLNAPVTVGIFAGASPLSMQVGIRLNRIDRPLAVCTSSGTLGHSQSFGRADAVCVISGSGALADAAATAIGNRVQTPLDINSAITTGQEIAGVSGIVIVAGEKIGAWGDLEIVPLKNPGVKKG